MGLRSSSWLKGTLYEQLDQYRAELDALQQQAAARLLLVYSQSQQATMRQFEDLAARIQADIAAGKPFSADRLRRMERYTDLLRATEQRVNDFAEFASDETRRLQIASIRAAEARGTELMQLALADDLVIYPDQLGRGALPAGVTMADLRTAFNQLPAGLLDDLAGVVGDGTPLRQYFLRGTANVPALSLEVVQGLERALIEGLGQGLGPATVARRVSNALAIATDRALRIARTESLRVERTALHAQYLENADVVTGWRWTCNLGLNTCAACIAMDGTIHPLTEILRDHPNGGCQPTPVTTLGELTGHESWRRAKAEDGSYSVVKGDAKTWFETLTPEQQRKTLGKASYDAWKAGRVGLNDFVGTQNSETFGTSIIQASLKQMLGPNAQQFYARGTNGG